MARPPSTAARGGHALPGSVIVAERALRLRMLEFTSRIGLQAGTPPDPSQKGGKGHQIFDQQGETPQGMFAAFPEELGAAQRLGLVGLDRAYVLKLPPYQVHCLAYYHYDGLCTLLYVEKGKEFCAAWCEREVESLLAPHKVLVNGTEEELRSFLQSATATAREAG